LSDCLLDLAAALPRGSTNYAGARAQLRLTNHAALIVAGLERSSTFEAAAIGGHSRLP
jgi:hypothetical protein